MISGFSLSIAATLTIGLAWLIGVVCLYQKYKSDQKACTVADFFKLTFSALTLALTGYLVFNLSFARLHRVPTIVERIAPLMDYRDGVYLHPRWFNENEPYEARLDREDRAKKIDEIVGAYLSYFAMSSRVGNSPLAGEGDVWIKGTPDFPMADVVCTISSVRAGPPSSSVDSNMQGSFWEKRAYCNILEIG